MRRSVLAVSALALLAPACGGSDSAGPSASVTAPITTGASSTAPATSPAPSTAPATTPAPDRVSAASAVIEPDSVAGIRLGATRQQAIDVLGQPDSRGEEKDVSGQAFEFLRWQFGGGGVRGLTLSFRPGSRHSPGLTDWIATAAGPTTAKGITVGDAVSKVVAAYGPLTGFCCNSQIAGAERGGGRMVVVVPNDTRQVVNIIGGDPAGWSRSIAD